MTKDSRGFKSGKSVTGEDADLSGAPRQSTSGPSRRHFLGAVGGIGVATATGAGLDAAVAAPGGRQNPGRGLPLEREGPQARAFGPTTYLTLGAIDFHPANSAANLAYNYIIPGGVQVTAGSAFFNSGLRLPAGTRLLQVLVYLNPNGGNRLVTVTRYRPLNPAFTELASANSTAGNAVETVTLNFTHTMLQGYNYRIDNLTLGTGGAILYGARVKYQLEV